MKVIVIGRGPIGSAVQKKLVAAGHEVLWVSRRDGIDLTDVDGLRRYFASVGRFDGVACCAGEVMAAPLALSTDEQWARSLRGKAMGQIDVVRAALPHIADGGSFVLVSGVLTDERMHAGVIGTTVNHVVEGFVKGAAAELPRGVRINCVSPTVLTESTAYHAYFPGFPTVDAADVATAYLRALSNPTTGRVLKLHRTDG
jgi:NAD(P)-dependent dehydrogenase (short-subunit alcohol dehydrogenase family)